MTSHPRGWAVATIGDLTQSVEVVDWAEWPATDFTYVDIGSIDNSTLTIASARTLPVAEAPSRARQVIRVGDTVFSTVRTYLRNIGYVTDNLDGQIASTGFAVLRPVEGLTSRFLYYYVQSPGFTRDVSAQQRGVSYPAVTNTQVRAMPIQVPPLAEQERIVVAIEQEFSRIDSASRSIQTARRRADVLMTSALNLAVAQPQDAAIWAAPKVRDLVERMDYGTSAKASRSEGIPVLRMNNIRDGRVESSDLKFLPADHPDSSKFRLQVGDVLFNRTNSRELVGKTAVYNGDPPNAAFASYLVRLRPRESVDPRWLAGVINSELGRAFIRRARTQQVGQANVSASKLADMTVPLPPRAVQVELLDGVDEWTRSARALRYSIALADTRQVRLRDSVLAAAFTGMLVSKDTADGPATASVRIEARDDPRTVQKAEGPSTLTSGVRH